MLRRSPHGERGLKLHPGRLLAFGRCRSPHGERGLKSIRRKLSAKKKLSLPAWGAWVEIPLHPRMLKRMDVAPRMGSVG